MTAPKQQAKKTYKVGDIWDVPRHSLVARPDGVVVTAGGPHALNLPGEYVCTKADGSTESVTVPAPRKTKAD